MKNQLNSQSAQAQDYINDIDEMEKAFLADTAALQAKQKATKQKLTKFMLIWSLLANTKEMVPGHGQYRDIPTFPLLMAGAFKGQTSTPVWYCRRGIQYLWRTIDASGAGTLW